MGRAGARVPPRAARGVPGRARRGAAVLAESVVRLADDLVAGVAADDAFHAELLAWLGEPRFRTFAERHRDKIRRKLRSAADEDGRRDVRAELSVAARLLADRRFELAYEPYGSGRLGPDFGVTFRAGLAFNLEVTRPRPRPDGVDVGRAVVAKIRQMPPSTANVLLLDIGGVSAAGLDIAAAIRALRQAVDGGDATVLARLGVGTPRAFYERFLRLAAVAARSEAPPAATLWANPSARIALPDAAGRALMTTLGDGAGEGR